MIEGYGPVTQALLGTLLTWGLTALGAAMVIFLRGNQVNSIFHSLCISSYSHFILSTATTTMPTDSKQTQSVSGIRTFRAANIALKQKCHLFVCLSAFLFVFASFRRRDLVNCRKGNRMCRKLNVVSY